MSENSKIEWCDHTFNPWEGCTKVSPGCLNCYAEARNNRFTGGANWGKGKPRRRTSEANWKLPLKWNRHARVKRDLIHAYTQSEYQRPRVFCASLADWLDDEVSPDWQNDLLRLIERTPNLDWLLLTKRPENWEGVMANALLAGIELAHEWVNSRPPANVWLGTTVEDQARADERIPLLLNIPAKVRFLSCEPLLGPVDLERVRHPDIDYCDGCDDGESKAYFNALTGREFCDGDCDGGEFTNTIHWVICGGESGQNARPMHPDWARSLRDQCNAAGVPFLFKQWGEWVSVSEIAGPGKHFSFPDYATVRNTGKKIAGRLLDGREWNEFPEVAK